MLKVFLYNSGSAAINKFVNIICTIISLPVLVSHLGEVDYGYVVVIMSFAHWISFDNGISEGLKIKILSWKDKRHRVTFSIWSTIYLLSFLIITVMILIVAIYQLHSSWFLHLLNLPEVLNASLLLAFLLTCLLLISKLSRDIVTSFNKGWIYFNAQTFASILSFILIVNSEKLDLNINSVIIALTLPFILANVFGLVYFLINVLKIQVILPSLRLIKFYKYILGASALMGVFGVARIVQNTIDPILINKSFGPIVTSEVYLTVRYLLYLEVLAGFFSYAIWPILSRYLNDAKMQNVKTGIRYFFAGYCILILFILLFQDQLQIILNFWLSISPSDTIFLSVSLYLVARLINDFSIIVPRSNGDVKLLSYTSFVFVIIQLCIGIYWLPEIGVAYYYVLLAIAMLLCRALPSLILTKRILG